MVHWIEKIIDIEPYKLTLKFNTGEIRTVDLNDKLKEWGGDPQSKFAELKNPATFKKVKIDDQFGSLYWPNGIDLCADFLYDLNTKKSAPHRV